MSKLFEIVDGGLQFKKEYTPTTVEKACRDSISKWEFIKKNHDSITSTRGVATCALCRMFAYSGGKICLHCPISLFVGATACEETPHGNTRLDDVKTITAEINFLKKVQKFVTSGEYAKRLGKN